MTAALRVAAAIALACLVAMPGHAADGTTVEFQGRQYHVPLQPAQVTDWVYVRRFGTAMEVELPVAFWNGLYPAPAAATGWQLMGENMPLRLTLPDESHAWSPGQPRGRPAGYPPVPQKLASVGVQHGVHVWKDTGSGAPFGRFLLTYRGRADFYVVCDRRQIWNQRESCDLVWNDAGVLGIMPIYGNLVASAPGFLDAFRTAIRPGG